MQDKAVAYEEVFGQIKAVLEGEDNQIVRMTTISCLLSQAFPDRYYWTGFYIVDPDNKSELMVGPYQGTLGCLRIPFGRGVCGQVAQSGTTLIVEDVHAHPGHIACDSRTNSEIVLPVYNENNELLAVLDVDSLEKNAFDPLDQFWLEKIITYIFQ